MSDSITRQMRQGVVSATMSGDTLEKTAEALGGTGQLSISTDCNVHIRGTVMDCARLDPENNDWVKQFAASFHTDKQATYLNNCENRKPLVQLAEAGGGIGMVTGVQPSADAMPDTVLASGKGHLESLIDDAIIIRANSDLQEVGHLNQFVLLKFEYASPCRINGLTFNFFRPEQCSFLKPIAVFGKMADKGVTEVSPACNELFAVMTEGGQSVFGQANTDLNAHAKTNITFFPASGTGSIPASTELQPLCWVLCAVKAAPPPSDGDFLAIGSDGDMFDFELDCATMQQNTLFLEEIQATKPVYTTKKVDFANLNSAGTAILKRVSGNGHLEINNWSVSEWASSMAWTWVSLLTHFRPSILGLSHLIPDAEVHASGDTVMSLDGVFPPDLSKLVAYLHFIWNLLAGEQVPVDTTANIPWPMWCCDEEDVETKDQPDPTEKEKDPGPVKVEENEPPFDCKAGIEILNVVCVSSDEAKEVIGKANKAAGAVNREVLSAKSNALPAAAGTMAGLELSAVKDFVANIRTNDCEEENANTVSTEDPEANDMLIYIGLSNQASIGAFQFDVAFNKYSSVPNANIGHIEVPETISKNWTILSKAFDDRFGFDKVVRVVAIQPLLDFTSETMGQVNISDEKQMRGLHLQTSILPNGQFRNIVVVHVRGARPTSCPCPVKKVYMTRNALENIPESDRSDHQKRFPEQYEHGKEWHGPTVLRNGKFYTASNSTGEPMLTRASVPLRVGWDGIALLNKRVVTNERLTIPKHSSHGLEYLGDWLGYKAVVPENYETPLSYFLSEDGLMPWMMKTIANGLELGNWPAADCSKYKFLWEQVFMRYREGLAAQGRALTAAEIEAFSLDKIQGFSDDATLDGMFDVADLLALYNSAQFRLLIHGKTSGQANDADVSKLTGEGDREAAIRRLEEARKKKEGKSDDDVDEFVQIDVFESVSGDGKQFSTTMVQMEHLSKIVPTYCLKTYSNHTLPDMCPNSSLDGRYAETHVTKWAQYTSQSFFKQFISQRFDTSPDKAGKARFVFSGNPKENSYFQVEDTEGVVERLKFAAQATGTKLDGGFTSIQRGANLNATLSQLTGWFSSGTATNMSAAVLPSSDGFELTQGANGSKGNTRVLVGGKTDMILKSPFAFEGGKGFKDTLPLGFKHHSEYYWERYNIPSRELYQNEERYGAGGATFFEIRSMIPNPFWGFLRHVEDIFVHSTASTINFCGGWDAATTVRFKVLPGDGFNMVDVYDAETGALLTTTSATEYHNFYTVPSHGKVSLVSHNYLSYGASKTMPKPDFSNSKYNTPLTNDGGTLVSAKVFVTPQPDWAAGKYIELLDGDNPILGNPYAYSITSDSISPSHGRLHVSDVGPKSSQFSQWYYDDSSSLHTYADYMLHTEVIDPKHIKIRYNTMKPFKYASFTVKTHNNAEINKVVLCDAGNRKGWHVDHTFNEAKPNVYGRPLQPTEYLKDGYSIVNVYITGSFTDEAGTEHKGVAYPEAFTGYGELCDIHFKEPIFDKFPNPEKSYICPPIGQSNGVEISFPNKAYSKDKTFTDGKYGKITGVETNYPQGNLKNLTRAENVVALYSSQVSLKDMSGVNDSQTAGVDYIDMWRATPGSEAVPHQSNNAHRPKFSKNTNDERPSLLFEGGMGLSSDASGVGLRTHDIHQWSAYALVDMTATLDSSMTNSAPDEAVIFSAGGDGQTQFKLVLSLVKAANNDFILRASSSAKDSVGSAVTTNLDYTVTVNSGSTPKSPLHGWHVISWIGDVDSGTVTLYVDGTQVATSATTHHNGHGEHGIVWHIGHDGTANSINSTVGNAATGKPFAGRIHLISLSKEAHVDSIRQSWEAWIGLLYQGEGTKPLRYAFPEGHWGGSSQDANGNETRYVDERLYLKTADAQTAANDKKREAERAKMRAVIYRSPDLGSDRCAAQWVSDHVCLDKSAQTLLNISCAGTGEGFFLGD